MKTVTIIQNHSDLLKALQRVKKYSPAFEFYIKKLNRGNKLPRGKYFKNRMAGHNPVIMDEFWMGVNSSVFNEAYRRARAY
ncbi:hypothetical protein [Providencia alcalifaciens]|uniref:hypothetical protein n=1 Tax=Providencia alcalifaciens TaxID=126385 RepID=UPI002B06230C|nr:hypothetical protein [Providencia alcalifaciens]